MSKGEAISPGDRVMLKTFKRTVSPPQDIELRNGENYWLLIGRAGYVANLETRTIVDTTDRYALVVFDDDPSDIGLHCHNEIPKSLYIRLDDLEVQERAL